MSLHVCVCASADVQDIGVIARQCTAHNRVKYIEPWQSFIASLQHHIAWTTRRHEESSLVG